MRIFSLILLLFLFQAHEVAFAIPTYYDILGVSPHADSRAIKVAYSKLALRWHPDKHCEQTRAAAHEKFIVIQKAYEILSDPHRREKYDGDRVLVCEEHCFAYTWIFVLRLIAGCVSSSAG